MLHEIHLHGALGAEFGRKYHFAVETVGEVITGGSLISGGIEINGPRANEAPPVVTLADLLRGGLTAHQSQGSHR